MESLVALLPVTVLAAVLLFVAKEVMEAIRRYRSDARTKAALRALLGYECERNNWAVRRLRQIFETIQSEQAENEATEFSLQTSKNGLLSFKFRHPQGERGGSLGFPDTQRDFMSKQLLLAATLDKDLYTKLLDSFDAVGELEHLRLSLIHYLEPDDDEMQEDALAHFVEYALRNLDAAYAKLDGLYALCTGKKLEAIRLR